MRKPCLTLLILLFIFRNGHAQEIISKAEDVFFNTDFCAATLYSEGHIYRGLKVRINLRSNEVRFVKENSDEIEMSISFRVKKLEFAGCAEKSNTVFRSGFPVITSRDDKDFLYQVLDSGKVTLLKSIRIVEKTSTKDFQYGRPEPVYERHENYYAYTDATKSIVSIERTKEGIFQILGDKKEMIDKFITENNIRLRGEEDLLKVFVFYNSL